MKRLILILISCMFVSQAFCVDDATERSWEKFREGAAHQASNAIRAGLKVGAVTAVAGALLGINHELMFYGGTESRDLFGGALNGAVLTSVIGFGTGYLCRTGYDFVNEGSKVCKYIYKYTQKDTQSDAHEDVPEVAWRDGGAFASSAAVLGLGYLAVS